MTDNFLDDLLSLNDEPIETRESYLRSPIYWPGGKLKSLDQILPRLPYRNVFVDVCGGSGTVMLNRRESKCDVYNDRFSGLVAFYRCIRSAELTEKLISRLELTLFSREEFVWCKETWESVDDSDDVERAARWYYTNVVSFGGMGRSYGRNTSGNGLKSDVVHKRLELFYPLHHRFKDVFVENCDFSTILKDYNSHDAVLYIDPPYLNSDPGCYKCKFAESDHSRLLESVMNSRSFVAVSHWPHPLYASYDWDEVYEWEVNVSIDGKAETESNNRIGTTKGNSNQVECLFIKHES